MRACVRACVRACAFACSVVKLYLDMHIVQWMCAVESHDSHQGTRPQGFARGKAAACQGSLESPSTEY